MNPLTKVKLINELNEREADLGISESVSWHNVYRDSAWVFVGGFPYDLTEGDLICVFSQYGEVVNINLVRDKKTGKSKGFCFLCYEDQRSTVLAVDNFNGIKIKGRTLRVDHVKDYRPPKDDEEIDDVTKRLREDGCAPAVAPAGSSSPEEEEVYEVPVKKPKKDKKEKKKKKKKEKKKKERKSRADSSSSSSSSSPPPSPHPPPVRVKEEKEDASYEIYNHRRVPSSQNGEERRETDREEDRRRCRERESDRKREAHRERREADREQEGRRETDRDRERRREVDREDKRKEDRRDTEREREKDRDHKRRERDRDDRRREDRR